MHITKFAFKMLMAKVILVELTFPALLFVSCLLVFIYSYIFIYVTVISAVALSG